MGTLRFLQLHLLDDECLLWSACSARPIQRAAISTIAALSSGLLICRERVRKYFALRRHSSAFMSPLPRTRFPPASYKRRSFGKVPRPEQELTASRLFSICAHPSQGSPNL